MVLQKNSLTKKFIHLLILCFTFGIGSQVLAEQKDPNEQANLSEPITRETTDYNDLSSTSKSVKDSTKWMDHILGPIIKYTPAEGEHLPYEAVPPWLDSWRKFKKQMLEQYGTNIGIVLDDHHQQILNGPGARKGRNLFWWNLGIDQNLWQGARLIFKARGSNTDGNPPNGITPLVGSRLNLDWAAYETEMLYVANLYLEQKLFNDKFLLAIGKITFPSYFDENKYGSWDFFSHSLARNQAYPHIYHTIGVLGRYDITDSLYVQAGITDAQGIRSETGLNTALHDEDYFITMGELGIKTKNKKGLEGNYRFEFWYNPQPLTRYDGKGTERDSTGYGVSFDQALTEKLGAFFRYGWNDGRVNKFSNCWSVGGTYKGLIPQRDKDVLAFGVAQGITHPDFRRANNATDTETIIEAYYKIFVTDWCSLTLDIQTLLNTGTNSNNDNAVIPGFRLKMVF